MKLIIDGISVIAEPDESLYTIIEGFYKAQGMLFDCKDNDMLLSMPLNKKTIFFDYGGANVAKALHVGHLRSANIGEALKRLCEAVGYKTISDVHYGDWGRPMGLIICEIKHRYPNLDFFNPNLDSYPKESPITLEDLYTIYPLASAKAKEDEEYLNEARELTVKLQKKEKGIYDLYKAFTKLSILDIEDIFPIYFQLLSHK